VTTLSATLDFAIRQMDITGAGLTPCLLSLAGSVQTEGGGREGPAGARNGEQGEEFPTAGEGEGGRARRGG